MSDREETRRPRAARCPACDRGLPDEPGDRCPHCQQPLAAATTADVPLGQLLQMIPWAFVWLAITLLFLLVTRSF